MTENRDFLKEMEELRSETDGIRDALVSKTGHFHNLLFDSGVLKEIVGELKAIRKENKENQEKNDKKIEELKTEMAGLKLELLQENREIRQKLEELQNRMLQEMKKIQQPSQTVPEIPIRQAILGEWKMIDHQNFERWKKNYQNWTFEEFSENVKYELVDGKLRQTGGAFGDLVEGRNKYGGKELFVEDDHLKTFWSIRETVDRYIENGKLHVVWNYYGEVIKRVYEKI